MTPIGIEISGSIWICGFPVKYWVDTNPQYALTALADAKTHLENEIQAIKLIMEYQGNIYETR